MTKGKAVDAKDMGTKAPNMKSASEAAAKQTNRQGQPLPRALLGDDHAMLENCDAARELYNTGRFGEQDATGTLQLSMLETCYLLEKNKIQVVNDAGKSVAFDAALKKAKKQPGFRTKYVVFRDMRDRGYIVKTALKFGAEFRVYDRGVKPGEDHAKWVLFPIHETATLTWHDFSAKNRVAHGTKKKLLLGIVDDEGEVTYFENAWVRP